MLKWQERNRQRIHDSIIEHAKPTIKINSNNKSRQKTLTTSRTKQIYNPNQLPFIKILQLFQLQKYSNLLIDYGFPHRLTDKKSKNYIDQILAEVDQADQDRFLSLMNTLLIMSKDLKESLNHKKSLASDNNKKHKNPHYPPTNNGFRQSSSVTNSDKKSQKNLKFRVKPKLVFNQSPKYIANYNQPFKKQSKSIQKLKQQRSSMNKKQSKVFIKTPSKKKTVKKAYDDINITHDFRHSKYGKPENILKHNKLIKTLTQKLQRMNPTTKKQKISGDIELEYQKIKTMYLSFDSATLSSNINNIDLQQILDCFVDEIFLLMDKKIKRRSPIKLNQSKRRNNFEQEPLVKLQNKEEIQYLLKESLVIQSTNKLSTQSPLKQDMNPQIVINSRSRNNQQRVQTEEIQEQSQDNCLESPKEKKQNLLKRKLSTESLSLDESFQESQQSQIFVDQEIQSFVDDFTCFDSKFPDEYEVQQVNTSDIKNFVQLIIMAGKMQKQMPIIAYAYLQKLLKNMKSVFAKPKLTRYNWKNIVLMSLILASKIWDDQSLQNNSFAKVLKPYTTYQLNRLQKYYLFYIDYSLTIDQKQYCESYFKLRNHTQTAHKTVHLMQLDLKSIQILQGAKEGIKKKQIWLKDYYKKKMDKSF